MMPLHCTDRLGFCQCPTSVCSWLIHLLWIGTSSRGQVMCRRQANQISECQERVYTISKPLDVPEEILIIAGSYVSRTL